MSRIEHFAIYAADAPALKDFYIEALGLRVILDNGGGDPPGFFLADDRGGVLEIIGRPRDEAGANQRWVCHLAFWVEDYAETRKALERRGLVFETGTAIEGPELQTAFFDDPEGNRLQIVRRARPLGS
jgi:glyoxylase I family protein